jgi:hypothetical protein
MLHDRGFLTCNNPTTGEKILEQRYRLPLI